MADLKLNFLGKRTVKTADSSFDSYRYADGQGVSYSSYEELSDGDTVAVSTNAKGFHNLAKVISTLTVKVLKGE